MSRANGDETVIIEGRIEASTAKAVLIELTNGGEPIWFPKSQIFEQNLISEGLYEFVISQWIARKNGV